MRTDLPEGQCVQPEHFGELGQLAGVQRLDMPFPRDERVVNQSVECWTKMATGSESLRDYSVRQYLSVCPLAEPSRRHHVLCGPEVQGSACKTEMHIVGLENGYTKCQPIPST